MWWQYLLGSGGGMALFALGWWGSARRLQPRIDFLQLQLKVTRQTAQAHTDQARRQIGQLQAELATRPPAPQTDVPAPAAEAPRRRVAAPGRFERHDDGFPQTAVIGAAFAPTELQA